MNSLAIYVNDEQQASLVSQIKNLPQIVEQNYRDFFVVSDNEINVPDMGRINSFYVGFAQIDVVFMNYTDYLAYNANISAKQTYVVTTANELLENQLELNELKNLKIIQL